MKRVGKLDNAGQLSILSMWHGSKGLGNTTEDIASSSATLNEMHTPSGQAHPSSNTGMNLAISSVENSTLSDTSSSSTTVEQPNKPIRFSRRVKGTTSESASQAAAQSNLFAIFEKKSTSAKNIDDKERPQPGASTSVAELALAATKSKPPRRVSNLKRAAASNKGQSSSLSSLSHSRSAAPLSQEAVKLSKPVSFDGIPMAASVDLTSDDRDTTSTPAIQPGSQEQPIILESSPVKSRIPKTKPSTGFFAPKKTPFLSSSRLSPRKRRRVGDGDDAPWPCAEEQHVGFSRDSFESDFSTFQANNRNPLRRDISLPQTSIESLKNSDRDPPDTRAIHIKRVSPANSSTLLNSILSNRQDGSMAISRFADEVFLSSVRDASAVQKVWCDRWHPRKAAEVIGNELSAGFLRDWLLALAVDAPHTSFETDFSSGSQLAYGGSLKASDARYSQIDRGTKKRNIVRAVDKMKQRKRRRIESDEESLDDWMVGDDSEEEAAIDFDEWEEGQELANELASADEGDDNSRRSPWSPRLTRLSRIRLPDSTDSLQDKQMPHEIGTSAPRCYASTNDFSSFLSNCILLNGPPGSGKTAAVYACAEELGWEVFEVYPGIGKRNGASLASLVGDVGKNHIVAKGARPSVPSSSKLRDLGGVHEGQMAERQQAFDSFLLHSKGDKVDSTIASSMKGLADASHSKKHPTTQTLDCGFGFLASGPRTAMADLQTQPSARQSIILLEEVDVLFGEDAGFWPMVVNLIKDSRRPVIMTCNDTNIIPVADLPLQTTLAFQPCPVQLAATYLQCIAVAEGYAVAKETVEDLTKPLNLPLTTDSSEEVACHSTKLELPVSDIRRAIYQLQFLCQGCPRNDGSCEDLNDCHETKFGSFSSWCYKHGHEELDDWEYFLPSLSAGNIIGGENRDPAEQNATSLQHLLHLSDALSSLDSHIRRRPWSSLQAFVSEQGSSSDAEIGFRHLTYEPLTPHLQGGIPLYNYDDSIASEVARCSFEAIRRSEVGTIKMTRSGEGRAIHTLRRRSMHFSHTSDILRGMRYDSRVIPRDALFLDYEAWVRNMIAADDLLEAIDAQKTAEARALQVGGRTTRNSQRMKYERYITLSSEQLQLVRNTAFRVDDTLCTVDHQEASSEGHDAGRGIGQNQ